MERSELLLERPESTGLFVDFDGTLSPIVAVPSDARPAPGARDLLERLAQKFAITSVVSGRSAADLLEWLGSRIEIWGLHGAERAVDGRVKLSPRVGHYFSLMQEVRRDAARRLEVMELAGVSLEDKGVMLTLHYRTAVDPVEAERVVGKLVLELASRHGVIPAEGKMSFELRPPIELSKAEVVLERSKELQLTAVAFAGDDVVDLPAFDALDALATEGLMTLRVAVASPEAPSELLRRADVVVDGTKGLLEWLRSLAD